MSSSTAASSGSPITKLPYDILLEIFTDCLPRHYQRRLLRRLPITLKAPIVLCHICQSWRRLVLASPTLWARLSYRLTVTEYKYDDEQGSASFRAVFSERDIELLRWWRRNQGQVAPLFDLDVNKRHWDDSTLKLTGDNTHFLLEYLSSAQYLKLDMFYWIFFLQKFQAGYPIAFPNLHTLLLSYPWMGTSAFRPLRTLLHSLHPHAFPALRRFSLTETASPDDFAVLPHWSTLTDLSLHISISFDLWLSLIRAVPHLRWGYFYISISTPPSGININDVPPPQCTMLELTTLTVFISSDSELERDLVYPLGSFFAGLHLPSLRKLSLSSPGANTWEDVRAIRELYRVLNSTPELTKLSLEDRNMSFEPQAPLITLPIITDIEPIWHHSKALAHLQFALPADTRRSDSECEEVLALFVRYIFSADSVWLDLRNTASPICAVTIKDDRTPQYHPISDLTMSIVRESACAVPNVAFDISWGSDTLVGVEVREEWGSMI